MVITPTVGHPANKISCSANGPSQETGSLPILAEG